MMKSLVAAIVLAAFSSAAAAMEPTRLVRMTDSQLDQVVAGQHHLDPGPGVHPSDPGVHPSDPGGHPSDPPSPSAKGNNGWGNGADPSNPGSPQGQTAPSKIANGTAGPGVNTNPTTSSGR